MHLGMQGLRSLPHAFFRTLCERAPCLRVQQLIVPIIVANVLVPSSPIVMAIMGRQSS